MNPTGRVKLAKPKKKISIYITEDFEYIIEQIKKKRPHLSINDIVKNALLIYYELLYATDHDMDPCRAVLTGGF